MKFWHKIVLTLIVASELSVIGFIGYSVYKRILTEKNVLGASAIVPINKDYLIFSPNAELSEYYEYQPNIQIQDKEPWMSNTVVNSINSDTLNDLHEYSVDKPSNVYRIVALGDSFTFGHHVNTIENWPSQLEAILSKYNTCSHKKFEVINLGMPGYDMLYASHRYQKRGEKYSPDLVLWLLNDHNFFYMPQLFKKRADELERQIPAAEKLQALRRGEYSYIWNLAIKEVESNIETLKIIEQENASLYSFSKWYAGPVVFFSHNVRPRFLALLKVFRNFRRQPTYIDDAAIDIDSIEGYTLADGHPSAIGHRFLAQTIYTYLTNQKLLPCQSGLVDPSSK